MHFSSTLTASALVAGASAAQNYLGFNSGSTLADTTPKVKSDFTAEFQAAQKLQGAPGVFNAVRLYTNIQGGTTSDPIQAFSAAIDTKTYILLGVWTSGTSNINNEIAALQAAVTQYGSAFMDLVIGISIGSEDLYRNSATGVANKAGVGNQPANIVNFINDFKKAFANSPLAKIPVGHVDTWDVWGNATNKPVLDAIDWIGVDEYPYYENGKGNDIKNAQSLFDTAYNATIASAGGKPVWVTETGWPVSGPNWDQAVPSVANAQYYWDNIGCRRLFGKTPTFWYTLRESDPANKANFAVTNNLSTTPAFNLTCPTTFADGTTSSSSGGSSGGGSSQTGTTGGSGSGSSNGATTSASPKGNAGARSVQLFPAVYSAALALVAGVAFLF